MRLLVVAVLGAALLATGAKAQSDPLVRAATFGGSRGEAVRAITTDAGGNVYVTGGTESPDFPFTHDLRARPARGAKPIAAMDVFVAKFDPAGRLVWSTRIGGPSYDRTYAIRVDAAGHVYIGGRAGAGFPVTPDAFQPRFPGGPAHGPYPSQSGFVAKLAPDGRSIVFASYFGAGDDPSHPVRDLAIDADGDLYVASSSTRGTYPPAIATAFVGAPQPRIAGKRDAVVAKIRGDGRAVLWATYLGGRSDEWGEGSIALASDRSVYLLTVSESRDAPVTPGALQPNYRGRGDFLLARIAADGRRLLFSTYLGGSHEEVVETHQLAVAGNDEAIVAASTRSVDFPVSARAFQRHIGARAGDRAPLADVVVARIAADGSRVLAATFFGGRGDDQAEGVAVDADGRVHVTGATHSTDLPTTAGAPMARRPGPSSGFVAVLAPDLAQVPFATYFGGSGPSAFRALALDPAGRVVVGGTTRSARWPRTTGAVPRAVGPSDATLAVFAVPRLP